MSWYLFKQSPAIQYRGIKVAGFQEMHRPKINISWGLNEKLNQKSQIDTLPLTIQPRQQLHIDHKNLKVLTESSDNTQEQLVMLIKNQKQRNQKEILDMYKKSKSKSKVMSQQQSKHNNHSSNKNQNQNSSKHNKQINRDLNQRIKYLQQNLLPAYKKDSMNTIFNHDLNKSLPLSQSQVSYRSSFHNKKNQSNVELGNGFNAFNPPLQKRKQLTDQLRERYDYQDKYKQRIQRNNIVLG